MNLYYESSNELYHHGIKGMKWGRRRYQNSDGSLTPAGIKRYATKGYAQDSYNSNKSKVGKAYDKVTGAHKIGGQMMYNLSTDKQRKARAEQYAKDEQARKAIRAEQKQIEKYAKKGFTEDSYNSNKTKLGKAYDKVTGAHKIGGDLQYNMASDKERKARAEKYMTDEQARKEANTRQAKKAAKEQALETHRKSLNKYYSDDDVRADLNYAIDRHNYGKKGVERISKRMDKGLSSFSAHAIETGRQSVTIGLGTMGGLMAVGLTAGVASRLKK